MGLVILRGGVDPGLSRWNLHVIPSVLIRKNQREITNGRGKILIFKGPYYESATVLHLTFFLHLTGIGKRKNP